jgi:hypothetical protein
MGIERDTMNPAVFSFMKRWSNMKGAPSDNMAAWTARVTDTVEFNALKGWKLKLGTRV